PPTHEMGPDEQDRTAALEPRPDDTAALEGAAVRPEETERTGVIEAEPPDATRPLSAGDAAEVPPEAQPGQTLAYVGPSGDGDPGSPQPAGFSLDAAVPSATDAGPSSGAGAGACAPEPGTGPAATALFNLNADPGVTAVTLGRADAAPRSADP